MDTPLTRKLLAHLRVIYPEADNGPLVDQLIATMALDPASQAPPTHRNLWNQNDVLLITYGNSVVDEGEKPLVTLNKLLTNELDDCLSAVHILPFFPYSSDDGFSVIDYVSVNESLGDWGHVSTIAKRKHLMADLVINHMSSRSAWFENFKRRRDPGKDYFKEASLEDDLSQVVRPRSSPLLTPVQTDDGERMVWCTFSPDQVDLDFGNPQVLVEFVRIIHFYLEQGVRIFRLDAVAYLWKVPGTSCIHLQQTHEVVKLMRTLIEHGYPNAVIITETNVPNRENLTYFGNANEAHVIYNFSLPPLLVHCLLSGSCRHLKTWAMSMPPAQNGTAYLNFIASHDGIGLRPAEDLLSEEELAEFIGTISRSGGMVSYRRKGDEDKPYELNVSLWDALKDTVDGGKSHQQLARFLCAHTIMLGLEGIPAFYIHSLFATENDTQKVALTSRNRSINRHTWSLEALRTALSNGSHHQQAYEALRHLIQTRRAQPAFHPNATQFTLHLGLEVFGFWRQSLDRSQSIFAIHNVSSEVQQVALSTINLVSTDLWFDLITGRHFNDPHAELTLQPYECLWLSNRDFCGQEAPLED
ncbi:MAG: sugar phosphorylase [Pseudomonadota bacterium]|uniref:sugar phosphorylase n=1 Tax=Gallaecimonas pentaromativorans TaxID=584787 RepID=UPI00067E6FC9|nr:sugar phosphorylase [Gallaecimonas pentaromativorans]MED5523245.1 sugar phosphorylase [Pseudomonadota bacterium]